MKYDSEIAAKIAEKFNISAATLRTWKFRDNIPDQYTKEKFQRTGKEKYKFVGFLCENKKYFNFLYLLKVLDMPRLADAILNRSTLNKNEVQKIKKYILNLLKKKEEEIIFEKSLHLMSIFNSNKICNWRAKLKRGTLTESDRNEIKNGLDFIRNYNYIE